MRALVRHELAQGHEAALEPGHPVDEPHGLAAAELGRGGARDEDAVAVQLTDKELLKQFKQVDK